MAAEKDKEKDEEKKDDKYRKKVNIGARTNAITPFVMLSASAIIAIYTYLQGYSIGIWLIMVCSTGVLFMFIGSMIQLAVEYAVDAYMEKKRKEEEALADEIDEGSVLNADGEAIPTDGMPATETGGLE